MSPYLYDLLEGGRMKPIGRTLRVVPGGHIPLHSTGEEHRYTSNDSLFVLNATDRDAYIRITIFYADRDPIGPYRIRVPAERVRHFRFNDLIDPEAMPLDMDYAAVIESDIPVTVQFSRQDTGKVEYAICTMMAFPDE